MVVFSFALRSNAEEPNPCNVRLAEEAKRIIDHEADDVVLVAQWETARALRLLGVEPDHVVELRADGSYLGSDDIWEDAAEVFRSKGIDQVILVANPYLHLFSVKRMVGDDFEVLNRKIGWVGFDRKSTQWWTKGPVELAVYAILSLFGYEGHGGKQHAAR